LKILIVDDERECCEQLARILGRLVLEDGIPEVRVAHDGKTALALLLENPTDLVLCDVNLPGMGGLEVARTAKQARPDLRIIMISGREDIAGPGTFSEAGCDTFFPKPLDIRLIIEYVKQCVPPARPD
jgi:DNA-binding response OmpR family regulator